MARHVQVEVSMTEAPHFRRLVELLHDVESHARVTADEDLTEITERCRADLAELSRGAPGS